LILKDVVKYIGKRENRVAVDFQTRRDTVKLLRHRQCEKQSSRGSFYSQQTTIKLFIMSGLEQIPLLKEVLFKTFITQMRKVTQNFCLDIGVHYMASRVSLRLCAFLSLCVKFLIINV